MNAENNWMSAFETEISTGERALREGKTGRARVCARRAAGIVIAEYFRRESITPASISAYDLLKQAVVFQDLSPRAVEICSNLLLRLTPDFNLPAQVDLLSEARELKVILLEETV